MATLTFEEKLAISKKNIEERVSRAGGVPERLYEDIVSLFIHQGVDRLRPILGLIMAMVLALKILTIR